MISKICIKNFKSLKDIEIECSNLNVLSGLNGMGKSSVIQALLLLRQSNDRGTLIQTGLSLNGDLIDIGVGKDALYQNADPEQITFDLSFTNHGTVENYSWVFAYNNPNEDVLSYDVDTTPPIGFASLPLFNDELQYLNAERWVKNQYGKSDFEVEEHRNLGKNGEYASHYLEYYGSNEIMPELLYPNATSNSLEYQVSAWMNEVSPGTKVKVKTIPGANSIKLGYEFETNNGPGNEFMATNVGFGITYSLSVIVALLSSKPGDILIVENPESHVHPQGQSSIGKLIALVASLGVQIFIETHSDHIINGILVACKRFESGEKGIDKDFVRMYYFARERKAQNSKVEEIKILKDGKIDKQPEGFFDQTENDLSYLLGF